MKNFVILLLISIIISGCAGSPVATGIAASSNKKAMVNLRLGMKPEQVIEIMGNPEKTEMYKAKGKSILAFLYITEGKNAYKRTWTEENYTPLVFEDNQLSGWGWNYYRDIAQMYEFIIKEVY